MVSVAATALALTPPASAEAGALSLTGVHPSGATYAIEVPRGWNGTVLTFTPGYGQGAGPDHLPADLGGDAASRAWLLAHGYALAGSRPYGDGWAVEETLKASADTLATFAEKAGDPAITLAWGASMGGAIAAGLAELRPDLIDGALPYCASVAGPVAMLNQSLDAAFAFKTLLAPGEDAIKLVRLASAEEEARSTTAARTVLDAAQQSAAGRARIALAASFAQVSTWSVPGTDEPAPRDWEAQQAQEYAAFMPTVFSPAIRWSSGRAGTSRGTPAWTTAGSCASRDACSRCAPSTTARA
ncbi:alpha/beta hydrolase [Nonomuraea salmonea]|uniref:alpha/beta fold hydrolase n=1 Tax=Nonomuraea salmonea TaxID=46181 RepID=UPI0031EA1A9E